MDTTSIGTALASLNLIRQALSAAIDIRDFNKAAAEIAKLNDALLNAQNAQLAQMAELFTLQQQKFEAAEKVRKLEEALTNKGRYTLVAISPGNLVYRANASPQVGGTGEPSTAEPDHYVCQPCFDKGVKVVLQERAPLGVVTLECSVCQAEYLTGERRSMGDLSRFAGM